MDEKQKVEATQAQAQGTQPQNAQVQSMQPQSAQTQVQGTQAQAGATQAQTGQAQTQGTQASGTVVPQPGQAAEPLNALSSQTVAMQSTGLRPQEGQAVAPTTESVTSSNEDVLERKWSHKIIIGSTVGAVVVIAGVLSAIFLPQALNTNYGETYFAAYNLNSLVNDLYDNDESKCGQMATEFVAHAQGTEKFGEMMTECKDELKQIRGMVNAIGEYSAVKKNESLRGKYAEMTKETEVTFPRSGTLDQDLQAYSEMYEFVEKFNQIQLAELTKKDVDEITKSLRESGNEKLKSFGQGMQERLDEIVRAYAELVRAAQYVHPETGMDVVGLNNLQAQIIELQTWTTEQLQGLDDAVKIFGQKEVQGTKDAVEAFYEEAREMYEAHYDGKNTALCHRDGEAAECE